MKKLALALLCAITLMAVGCKPKEKEEPNKQSEWPTEATLYIYSANYYGTKYTPGQEQVSYIFLTDGVKIKDDGTFSGTGYAIWIVSHPSSVDANFFPNTGTYNIGDGGDGSIESGYMFGSGVSAGAVGSYLRRIKNGAFVEGEEGYVYFQGGSMVLSGTMNSASFYMHFQGSDSRTYTFNCANTPVMVTDRRNS